MGISEERVQRLSGVPRGTRQDWWKAGLLDKPSPPYSLAALREIVVVADVRAMLDLESTRIVFRQLRPGVEAAAESQPPIAAVIDLRTLHAAWVASDSTVAAAARRGNAVQLLDVTTALARAKEGCDLAMRAATEPGDELADRRTRGGKPSQRKGATPSE